MPSSVRARDQSPKATRVQAVAPSVRPRAGERRTRTTATATSSTEIVATTATASAENTTRSKALPASSPPRPHATSEKAAKPPVVPASTNAERRGIVRARAASTAHSPHAAARARKRTVRAADSSIATDVIPTPSATTTAKAMSSRIRRDRGGVTAMHSIEGASTIVAEAMARARRPPPCCTSTNMAVDPTDSTPAIAVTRRKKCRGTRLPSCGRITPIMLTPSATHITASPIDSTMDPPRTSCSLRRARPSPTLGVDAGFRAAQSKSAASALRWYSKMMLVRVDATLCRAER